MAGSFELQVSTATRGVLVLASRTGSAPAPAVLVSGKVNSKVTSVLGHAAGLTVMQYVALGRLSISLYEHLVSIKATSGTPCTTVQSHVWSCTHEHVAGSHEEEACVTAP